MKVGKIKLKKVLRSKAEDRNSSDEDTFIKWKPLKAKEKNKGENDRDRELELLEGLEDSDIEQELDLIRETE